MIFLRKRLLIFVFFTIFCSSAQASDKGTLHLSFSEALQMARERHVQVIVANERVNQALARIGQSASALLPQFNASASETRQTRDLRSVGINLGPDPLVGPFNSFDARIRVTQTIFDLAAVERLKAAHDNRQLSVVEARKAEQDALALVATFFVEARQAVKQVKFTQTLVDRDRKHWQIALTRFHSGTGSILEARQAKSAYIKSVAARRTALTDAKEKRLDLVAALGIDQDRRIIFEDNNDPLAYDIPSESGLQSVLRRQPDILVAEKQLQERKSRHLAEKADVLPKISALADYGPSGEDFHNSNNTYTAGVQVSVPIFQGGLHVSRIKVAASQVKESQANLNDTQRHVEAKITLAIQSVQQAKAFLNQKEAEWAVARQQLVLAQQRVNIGSGNESDLLDSSAQEAAAYNDKEEARAAYLMTRINLAHALGQMDSLALK